MLLYLFLRVFKAELLVQSGNHECVLLHLVCLFVYEGWKLIESHYNKCLFWVLSESIHMQPYQAIITPHSHHPLLQMILKFTLNSLEIKSRPSPFWNQVRILPLKSSPATSTEKGLSWRASSLSTSAVRLPVSSSLTTGVSEKPLGVAAGELGWGDDPADSELVLAVAVVAVMSFIPMVEDIIIVVGILWATVMLQGHVWQLDKVKARGIK